MSRSATHPIWVIGFGNRQRRDDGLGPYIVGKLKSALGHAKGVRLMALPQLRVDLVEDLHAAGFILFIDATVAKMTGGWQWRRLQPEWQNLPYLTHHISPTFLLGLMEMLYRRRAKTWLFSVHGSDFEFGEGLSLEAARSADLASKAILEFIGIISEAYGDGAHDSRLHHLIEYALKP